MSLSRPPGSLLHRFGWYLANPKFERKPCAPTRKFSMKPDGCCCTRLPHCSLQVMLTDSGRNNLSIPRRRPATVASNEENTKTLKDDSKKARSRLGSRLAAPLRTSNGLVDAPAAPSTHASRACIRLAMLCKPCHGRDSLASSASDDREHRQANSHSAVAGLGPCASRARREDAPTH